VKWLVGNALYIFVCVRGEFKTNKKNYLYILHTASHPPRTQKGMLHSLGSRLFEAKTTKHRLLVAGLATVSAATL
jgi:hypothetical protein